MTAFSTCAYPGCYAKISYHPETDVLRPRYCKIHLLNNPRDLYITVKHQSTLKTSPDLPKTTPENVIFICPKCKARRTISYGDFCKSVGGLITNRICCQNTFCNGATMVFHKDVSSPEYMGFLQEYVK